MIKFRNLLKLAGLSVILACSLTACADDEYEDDYGYEDSYVTESEYSGDEETDFWDDDNAGYDEEDAYWDGQEGYDEDYSGYSGITSEHGLASELEGEVIVYTLFVSGSDYVWSQDKTADQERMKTVHTQLGIAADYLEKEAKKYGKNLELIYDWGRDQDLSVMMQIDSSVMDENTLYDVLASEVDRNLTGEIDKLKSRYDSDSVVILAAVNSPYDTQQSSYAFCNDLGAPEIYYEICIINTGEFGGDEPAAAYAHEILHTFGAPDYYMADTDGTNRGITQEFVDYKTSQNSNDLMFTTYHQETGDPVFDEVTNDIDDGTAYYIGWTDHSDTVEKWGLDER